MGNTSTSSAPSSVNETNVSISGNETLVGGLESFWDADFWSFIFSMSSLTEVMSHCHLQTGRTGWFGVKIFLLVTALPANAGLMWILLGRKGAMTASEVLGVNVAVMDVLYCLSLPLDIYTTRHESSESLQSANEALFALIIFGCPLLLTFMCLERYVAAARPVAYMKLGRREYRVVLCACAWILTVVVAMLGFFLRVLTIALYLSVNISVLFLVMLLCLLGIVRVLCQSGPGDGSGANVPLKRRALKNVLAVMVPSVVAYSPLIGLVPFIALNVSDSEDVSPHQCDVLQFLLSFPNFGLYIGPMFYLSRFRQVSCWRKETQTPNSKTQAE